MNTGREQRKQTWQGFLQFSRAVRGFWVVVQGFAV